MTTKRLQKAVVLSAAAALAAGKILRHTRRIDLRNKVVAITGGSRGLGLAMAAEFLTRGARVAICGRDLTTLERARTLLEQQTGKSAYTIQCDVTREMEAKGFVAQVESHFGRIDILVNNAGRIEVGPLEDATQSDFKKAMDTHFWAPLHTMQAVLPEMRARRAGRIVNISSIGGRVGAPHLTPYDASKFALGGLSEAMAAEVRKDGIRITTVYPGLMRTGSPRNANFKSQNKKEYAWFAVSDAAPLVTIGARKAARKIVDACEFGDAVLVLTPAARLGILAHDLAPGLVISLLGIVNRLLPSAGGIRKNTAKGRDSESLVTRSPLTALNRSVERELNQAS
jgi:NAD(P)-dependent dehydrogenase (short-subunit alcohol dehydrogenase family)